MAVITKTITRMAADRRSARNSAWRSSTTAACGTAVRLAMFATVRCRPWELYEHFSVPLKMLHGENALDQNSHTCVNFVVSDIHNQAEFRPGADACVTSNFGRPRLSRKPRKASPAVKTKDAPANADTL